MRAQEPASVKSTTPTTKDAMVPTGAKGEKEWFSERFTALPGYGSADIPNPALMAHVFSNVDGAMPTLNCGETPMKAGLHSIARLAPQYFWENFPQTWSLFDVNQLPTLSEAIARVLSDVAVIGVLAEATWRCQLLQAEGKNRPNFTYAEQVRKVLDIVKAENYIDPLTDGLIAAMDVDTSVINEFLSDANVALGASAEEIPDEPTAGGGWIPDDTCGTGTPGRDANPDDDSAPMKRPYET